MSNNLKGRAWDLMVTDGGRRLAIQRLDPMVGEDGLPAGRNDVFASDEAAREFVRLLAERGDRVALEALNTEMASVGLDELVDEEVIGPEVDRWGE